MVKAWYSAAELAGLPGLPGSARGVQIRAKRMGWKARPRKARGGGFEYHIDALAAEARVALGIERVSGASDRSALADARAARTRSDAARIRAALRVVAELKEQVRSVMDTLQGMATMLDMLEGGLRKSGAAGGIGDTPGYAENIAERESN